MRKWEHTTMVSESGHLFSGAWWTWHEGFQDPGEFYNQYLEEYARQNGIPQVLRRNGDAFRKETSILARSSSLAVGAVSALQKRCFLAELWGTQYKLSSPFQCLWSALHLYPSWQTITFMALAGLWKEAGGLFWKVCAKRKKICSHSPPQCPSKIHP